MNLWRKDRPIIESLMEIDVYKLLMLNFIDRYYLNLETRFDFRNRTKGVRLGAYIDFSELERELQHVATLRFTKEDVSYLRAWGIFPEHFLRSLPTRRLSPISLKQTDVIGTGFNICAFGTWSEATLWETFVLAIVNELYTRGFARAHNLSEHDLAREGTKRLAAKLNTVCAHPGLKFAQFGLRRRFSGLWEDHVTKVLAEEGPGPHRDYRGYVAGVSNVHLARTYDFEAVGTNAHELPMALYALARHESDEVARQSPYEVLRKWQMLYGQRLLIMLPDTFGTDAFDAELSRQYLIDWRGFRQDSGDPFAFANKKIALYHRHHIDPRGKLIVFSDGLGAQKIVNLHTMFHHQIGVTFGWGTDLTNDLGIPPLSLVMKMQEAAGRPTVKLSDNLAKATGDSSEVEVAKRIFGYTNEFTEQPKY